jgi:hypothetical protein
MKRPAMKNDRAHQVRMLRVCWEVDRIREALVESTKLFPKVSVGEQCLNPQTAVLAYADSLLKQNNLMLSLIEGVEGVDYPLQADEGDAS